jgi:hypothetical protein
MGILSGEVFLGKLLAPLFDGGQEKKGSRHSLHLGSFVQRFGVFVRDIFGWGVFRDTKGGLLCLRKYRRHLEGVTWPDTKRKRRQKAWASLGGAFGTPSSEGGTKFIYICLGAWFQLYLIIHGGG